MKGREARHSRAGGRVPGAASAGRWKAALMAALIPTALRWA